MSTLAHSLHYDGLEASFASSLRSSSMSNEVIVSIISSLIGGVLVTLIGLFFTRGKNTAEIELIRTQTQNLLKEAGNIQERRAVELEETESRVKMNIAQAEKLREEAAQLRNASQKNDETAVMLSEEVKQITSYKNYKKAFDEMEQYIKSYLEDCLSKKRTTCVVDLKLIAVAMTFSWEHFIVTEVPQILRDFPEATIRLDVLFIDHEYLNAQNISNRDIDWAAKSQSRIAEVKTFAKNCKDYRGRLKFRAKIYHNLPHWHGWLVNDDHLFLGRADWNYDNGHPVLRVGQNKYRHFDTSNSEGTERIELFKSWQKYYFNHSSELVCDSDDEVKD